MEGRTRELRRRLPVQRSKNLLLQGLTFLGVRRRKDESERPFADRNWPSLDALPETHQGPVQVVKNVGGVVKCLQKRYFSQIHRNADFIHHLQITAQALKNLSTRCLLLRNKFER